MLGDLIGLPLKYAREMLADSGERKIIIYPPIGEKVECSPKEKTKFDEWKVTRAARKFGGMALFIKSEPGIGRVRK